MSEQTSTARDASDAAPWFVRAAAIKSVDAEKRSIRVVASTPAVDSYGDIVEQSWLLDRFNANPVILWAHQSRDLPIGHGSEVEVVDGNLEMTINFVDEKANPKAPQVFESYRQGSMRAVSVGFYPNEVRLEKRDGRDVYVLAQNELMECSCTPIPANPEALAKMRARAIEQNAAGRGMQKEIKMDEKEKALAAAEAKAKESDARAKAAEEKLAAEQEHSKKLAAERDVFIACAVDSLVECGRFAKDEVDEQKELAATNPALFAKLAGKRTIRGAELTGASKLPNAPTQERDIAGDDNGASLDALAKKKG